MRLKAITRNWAMRSRAQCPNIQVTPMPAASLGRKPSAESLIWVAAWMIPTTRPTTSRTPSKGAPTVASTVKPSRSRVMGRSVLTSEALHQRGDHQVPATGQEEDPQLQRQGDELRRHHHHA